MTIKKTLFLATSMILSLTSCSLRNNDFIFIGFTKTIDESTPSPWIEVGLKTKKVQEYQANFKFYISVVPWLEKWWDENISDPYPNYKVVSSCKAYGESDDETIHLIEYFDNVNEFPKYEYWPLYVVDLEGASHYRVIYKSYVDIPFSFKTFAESNCDRGYINIGLACLNETTNSEIPDEERYELFDLILGLGFTISLNFEISNNKVVFSRR